MGSQEAMEALAAVTIVVAAKVALMVQIAGAEEKVRELLQGSSAWALEDYMLVAVLVVALTIQAMRPVALAAVVLAAVYLVTVRLLEEPTLEVVAAVAPMSEVIQNPAALASSLSAMHGRCPKWLKTWRLLKTAL